MTDKVKVIIFDIDGCLADDEHRRHLLPKNGDGSHKDGSTEHGEFDDYHAEMHKDAPYKLSRDLFSSWQDETMKSEEKYRFIFMTARPEKYRRETEKWLEEKLLFSFHYHGHKYILMMRRDGDKSTSPQVKYAMCIGMITDYHTAGYDVEIVAAHDDRKDVLDMYASMKFPAFLLNGELCKPWGDNNCPRLLTSPFVVRDNPPMAEPTPAEHNTEPSTSAAAPVRSPELAEIAGIFDQMSATLRSRAADYGYNAAKVAKVMQVLFPDGVKLDSEEDFEFWHLFELIIVKLTRFANSDLRHKDSIHDMAIYAGFIERLVEKHNIQKVQ